MKNYGFKTIEKKWQKKWEELKLFTAKIDKSKPKFYALVEFPYPSGAGLHVGHPRSFTAMDVIARKRRMEGFNVLFPIGFDAFGLPTERYAIKTGIHPKIATKQNIENFTKQLKSIGFSFNWDGVVNTTDPNYYKWTQWMFIQMFKAGLAYKGEENIFWCPDCKIGIANEELENGKCERCGSEVIKKIKSSWFLKMRDYGDKLLDGLKNLDFPTSVKTMQTNWIGKSVGAEIDFELKNIDQKLTIFTTRPDTIFGATYLVIAPEHKILENIKDKIKNFDEVLNYQKITCSKTDFERSEVNKNKTGIKLDGIVAINPFTKNEIPVFIADYVLTGYGTGAIMAVPAHDNRDYDFAKKFNLPIIPVVDGGNIENEAYAGDGIYINSSFLNGMKKQEATKLILEKIEELKIGRLKVNYKMKDWLFTRQRYWGEPIPMIYCEKCGWVPVPENELPLQLPEIDDYMPTDDGLSPLAKVKDWVNTKCPCCKGNAVRETDTMATWAGSSWYFLRYMDPHNNANFASTEALSYWGQVDWYEGGPEHVTRHLLYSRFWNKVLFDLGFVPNSEPYKKRSLHGMILAENGEKMSKSKGNVINPDEIVEKYGADTLRVYEMFIGPFDQSAMWSTTSMIGISRFLNRVYDLQNKISTGNITLSQDDNFIMHKTIKDVSERIEEMKFNTAISALMIYLNYIENMEKIPVVMIETFLKLLYPFAPHITEEMWQILNHKDTITFEKWPVYDKDMLVLLKINIVVSVNGKRRFETEIDNDMPDDEVKSYVLNLENTKKYIGNNIVKKVIVIKNKLVNIVI